MKKVFILLLMPLVMSMGCSKDDESSTPITKDNCAVSKITANGDAITFEYDEKGRINSYEILFVEENDKYVLTSKINYLNDRIEIKGYEEGILVEDYEFKLDASGKIIKAINKEYPAEALYSYNTEGYLIKEVYQEKRLYEEEYEGTHDYKYENGNLTSKTSKKTFQDKWSGEYTQEEKRDFIYDTNEENVPYSSLFTGLIEERWGWDYGPIHILYEHGYFGKKSKNRIISDNNNTYTYGKNANGKIELVKKSYSSWNESDINYSIEYQCDK